jgi:glutaminase
VDPRREINEGAAFVSTGRLPSPELVRKLVAEAHERFTSNTEGENSRVYPALARVPSDLFGVCVVGTNGNVYAAGDAEIQFSIMSVAKPFVFALVCQLLGPEKAREKIGVNATGLPFNSLTAIEQSMDGRTNPMVNSGAIATTSLAPGETPKDRWRFIHDGLSRFAGRLLSLNSEVYKSASETNHRNRGIARLLQSYGRIYCDPDEALDLYTRQSSLNVSASDLAEMGATLADGGVNPATNGQVIDVETCHCTLAVMAIAGLYETSGRWLYDVGLPGKSGIGGGIGYRFAGQRRTRDFCPAARRSRKQRKRAARGQVPVPAVGHGSVHVRARRLMIGS